MQRLRTRLRAGATAFPPATFALNFLTGALDSGVTFSRGSNATLVDSTGKITYAPANLLLQSQTFDNASWIKTRSSVTADATTSPDGTVNADKLVEDATAANNHFISQSVTTTAIAYTFTVYAKAAERGYVTLINSTVASGCCFDLITGVVGVASGATPTASTITDVGNGWYRCSITVTATAASNAWRINVMASNSANTAYNGDGTSGIYVWGAQLEQVTYQTTAGPYVATTSAAYYGPRFDYDPVTLAAKGLLIEEARTNLLLRSEEFDNATWIKSNSTVTANATTSPDGTVDAEKLVENTANAQHFVLQISSVTASTAYTFTVYLKAAERTRAALIDSGGSSATGVFDLSSGAVVSTSNCTASVSNSGNGWYRCSITFTSAVGQTGVNARVFLVNTGTNTTYTGDGTSGVFLYGAQLEAGAFATSYIPTVASQVTRSADVATMTGTNFSSWYNQSEGTFVAEAVTIKPTSVVATAAVLAVSDGTGNNRIMVRYLTANADTISITGGATEVTISQAYTANSADKLSVAYATNNYAFAKNGSLVGTDTSATPPVVNQLSIGNFIGGQQLNGHIRQIAYYNTRLPNATLQALTA